jgi:hypothetical protein
VIASAFRNVVGITMMSVGAFEEQPATRKWRAGTTRIPKGRKRTRKQSIITVLSARDGRKHQLSI